MKFKKKKYLTSNTGALEGFVAVAEIFSCNLLLRGDGIIDFFPAPSWFIQHKQYMEEQYNNMMRQHAFG